MQCFAQRIANSRVAFMFMIQDNLFWLGPWNCQNVSILPIMTSDSGRYSIGQGTWPCHCRYLSFAVFVFASGAWPVILAQPVRIPFPYTGSTHAIFYSAAYDPVQALETRVVSLQYQLESMRGSQLLGRKMDRATTAVAVRRILFGGCGRLCQTAFERSLSVFPDEFPDGAAIVDSV